MRMLFAVGDVPIRDVVLFAEALTLGVLGLVCCLMPRRLQQWAVKTATGDAATRLLQHVPQRDEYLATLRSEAYVRAVRVAGVCLLVLGAVVAVVVLRRGGLAF